VAAESMAEREEGERVGDLNGGEFLECVKCGEYGAFCHGDKRRNNPRFSQFSYIDENLRLRRKERKVKVIVQ
jgi:hypothetical protein